MSEWKEYTGIDEQIAEIKPGAEYSFEPFNEELCK